jgi:PTS system nitrogen regulatory IIA component
MSKIASYLNSDLITFLDVSHRNEALLALVNLAKEKGKVTDVQEFYNAIIDRESIVSTGIGMTVAIPHAKLPSYDDFFIAIGILRKGVDWNTIDDSSVRLIFMIGGPDDKQTEYLKILSGITSAVKEDDRRKKMLRASSSEEIMELLKGY